MAAQLKTQNLWKRATAIFVASGVGLLVATSSLAQTAKSKSRVPTPAIQCTFATQGFIGLRNGELDRKVSDQCMGWYAQAVAHYDKAVVHLNKGHFDEAEKEMSVFHRSMSTLAALSPPNAQAKKAFEEDRQNYEQNFRLTRVQIKEGSPKNWEELNPFAVKILEGMQKAREDRINHKPIVDLTAPSLI